MWSVLHFDESSQRFVLESNISQMEEVKHEILRIIASEKTNKSWKIDLWIELNLFASV